jgi:superfamily II DNA/RNA helicase
LNSHEWAIFDLHLHGLEHFTMPAADNGANKLAALLDFAERGTYNQCVLFAASQERAALVLAALAARSFPAEAHYSHAGADELIDRLHRFRVGHMR